MSKLIRNNIIYLSGGGNEHQTFPLDKFFFGNLPKKGYFLYIPIALRDNKKIYSSVNNWMSDLLKLHKRTDLRFDIWNNIFNKKIQDLEKFDALYIGGGNTWSLLKEVRESDFDRILSRFIISGRIVYGGSAGAIILGKKVNTHNDENKVEWNKHNGLDMLNGYSVSCHYREKDDSKFRKWVIKNNNSIICLPEETGLIIKQNKIHCYGTKPCYIYTSYRDKIVLQDGDTFNIK